MALTALKAVGLGAWAGAVQRLWARLQHSVSGQPHTLDLNPHSHSHFILESVVMLTTLLSRQKRRLTDARATVAMAAATSPPLLPFPGHRCAPVDDGATLP